MRLYSLNVRGMAKPSKKQAILRLISSNHLEILMFQENMMDGTKLVKELHSLLPDWVFRLVNTKGLLGRLITSWKASYWSLNNSWDMDSVLSTELVSLITWKVYLLVNVYGAYSN